MTEKLARDRELSRRLGRNAYGTIAEVWNGENAAARLGELCVRLGLLQQEDFRVKAGCATDRKTEPLGEGPALRRR